MRIVKLLVATAIPFALLGCPDKANPDPAAAATPAAAGDAGAAAPAPKAGGSAAAPAQSGGW